MKNHISPRLKAILQKEDSAPGPAPQRNSDDLDVNSIFFHKDTMYRHCIMRINYTTYDVRRAQDTINPRTEHCNIMLLGSPGHNGQAQAIHQYRYAKVLGIYHVNVIYGGGPGRLTDYRPRRLEFLWVRWFDVAEDAPVQQGWSTAQLDQLYFSRIDREGAFGFVDPAQVLRSCHIVPRFKLGKVSEVEPGMSECANDKQDWRAYYINR